MPKTLDEVVVDAAELPPSERLKLARILIDISDPGTVPAEDAQEAWDEEIQRRLEDLRSGRVEGVPLTEVKRKIEARLHR